MTKHTIQTWADEEIVDKVEAAAEDLGIDTDEAARRFVELGLMDYEMMGDDVLVVTDD
jgi:antitoxin component of RelBE/YafQ-DinJ toxin-antitoxin module